MTDDSFKPIGLAAWTVLKQVNKKRKALAEAKAGTRARLREERAEKAKSEIGRRCVPSPVTRRRE